MAVKVLSCIQPTAEMHIGNYFGAVKNWVGLQEVNDCIYGIVDLHAMTMPYEPSQLRENTQRMVVDLLASGIDTRRTTLFIQSLVPEHTELCWILSCLCPFGELRRMTQFKEKAALLEGQGEGQFISSALFSYPVLQAADILLYRAERVPVGKDQEQHLELSRLLARRFNAQFGVQFFPEPSALFTEAPKVMSLADPSRKMSKSLGPRHYVGLFEAERSVRDKVRAAVTDSGTQQCGEMSPGVSNLFAILDACGKHEEASFLRGEYEAGKRRYRELKDAVADALVELTSDLRSRREAVLKDPAAVMKVKEMSDRARQSAGATLKEVRRIVGLPARD